MRFLVTPETELHCASAPNYCCWQQQPPRQSFYEYEDDCFHIPLCEGRIRRYTFFSSDQIIFDVLHFVITQRQIAPHGRRAEDPSSIEMAFLYFFAAADHF